MHTSDTACFNHNVGLFIFRAAFYSFEPLSPTVFRTNTIFDPVTVAILPVLQLPVFGVFSRLSKGVYIRMFYDSVAASSVTTFESTDCKRGERMFSKGQDVVPEFLFGALAVDENLINGKELKELDQETCTSLIHGGFIIPPDDVPELFYNKSFKLQLQSILHTKGLTVLSQSSGCSDMLPFNLYWKSISDLVISLGSLFTGCVYNPDPRG